MVYYNSSAHFIVDETETRREQIKADSPSLSSQRDLVPAGSAFIVQLLWSLKCLVIWPQRHILTFIAHCHTEPNQPLDDITLWKLYVTNDYKGKNTPILISHLEILSVQFVST